MRTVFVINPTAGPSNAAVWLRPAILAAAAPLGLQPEILLTTHPGHARELAERLAAGPEPARLYACGGDGTLNEVLQAAAGHRSLAVGCVPCGSGNDYLRNFGREEDFLDLDAQLQARPVTLDALDTSFGFGAAICAAGLDAYVAYNAPRFRRIPGCGGPMAYTLAMGMAACTRFGHALRITVDGEPHEERYMMATICNGRYYGGGYCAAPLAEMDDGWLDLVLVRPVPRLQLLGVLGAYKRGEHLGPDGRPAPAFDRWMRFCRAMSVRLDVLDGRPIAATVDGECALVQTMEARVAPGRLTMLIPPSASARRPAVAFHSNFQRAGGLAPQGGSTHVREG